MTKECIECLKEVWAQWVCHTCHTTYSRDVTLMVHRSVSWECIQVKKDSEGRYRFVYARVFSLPFAIIGLYNPPPANMKILKEAVIFMTQYPDAYVIYMGGFNMLIYPILDKNGKSTRDGVGGIGILKKFAQEVGWVDIWRSKYPHTIEYSCSVPGKKSMSRIDLILVNAKTTPLVYAIKYLPRSVSDHSPLVCCLTIGPKGRGPGWRVHPYWLSQMGTNDRVIDQL